MSASAPSHGSLAPRLAPVRPLGHFGMVSFALGLMVMFGVMVYVAWSAFGIVSALGDGARRVAAAPPVAAPPVAAAPVGAAPVRPTPSGSVLAFDQLWTCGDGNTIVAETPTVGTSTHTGESVIKVPVTLTNNTERDWNPESTTFAGTLNRTPVEESAEGDWMYRASIAAHTSVTLTKVFVGGRGRFALSVSTARGVALFTGRI